MKKPKIKIGDQSTAINHGEVVVLTVTNIHPDGSFTCSASDAEGPVGCTPDDWWASQERAHLDALIDQIGITETIKKKQ
jgi:hypothetical protein